MTFMTFKHFIAFSLAAVVATTAYFSGLVATENLIGSVITAAVILGLMGGDEHSITFRGKSIGMPMGIAVGITLGAVFAVSVSTTLDTLSKLA